MDEAAFLALTRRMGIDWAATLAELRRRHGVRRWFGFKDVVELPLGRLTPAIGGPFLTDWWPQGDPWPPLEFRCELIADLDPPAQHRRLDAELTALLGPGVPSPSVNVLGTGWRIGLFTVATLTFLRERSLGPNPLYQAHPELWRMTSVTIKADHGCFAPDPSLAPLAAERPALVLADGASLLATNWFPPLVRRNPPELAGLPADGYAVRSDGCRLVISAGELSLVADLAVLGDLELWRLAPARSGGYSRLEALLTPASDPKRARRVTLLRSDRVDGLDATAPALARLVGLGLAIHEGDDD